MDSLSDARIQDLIKQAGEARELAYAPYSKFKVGCALLTAKGTIFTTYCIYTQNFKSVVATLRPVAWHKQTKIRGSPLYYIQIQI